MTRLSFDLVKSAEDLGEAARDQHTAELAGMFGNITRQLQDIQLTLAARDQATSETSTPSDRPGHQQTSQRPADSLATAGTRQTA